MKSGVAILGLSTGLSLLFAVAVSTVSGDRHYILGQKGACDRVISSDSGQRTVNSLQTMRVGHRYPDVGEDESEIVTAVEVTSGQSSEKGKAIITEGGIGQKVINVVLTAQSTDHLNYEFKVYGAGSCGDDDTSIDQTNYNTNNGSDDDDYDDE